LPTNDVGTRFGNGNVASSSLPKSCSATVDKRAAASGECERWLDNVAFSLPASMTLTFVVAVVRIVVDSRRDCERRLDNAALSLSAITFKVAVAFVVVVFVVFIVVVVDSTVATLLVHDTGVGGTGPSGVRSSAARRLPASPPPTTLLLRGCARTPTVDVNMFVVGGDDDEGDARRPFQPPMCTSTSSAKTTASSSTRPLFVGLTTSLFVEPGEVTPVKSCRRRSFSCATDRSEALQDKGDAINDAMSHASWSGVWHSNAVAAALGGERKLHMRSNTPFAFASFSACAGRPTFVEPSCGRGVSISVLKL
jgi:hypothetical protein